MEPDFFIPLPYGAGVFGVETDDDDECVCMGWRVVFEKIQTQTNLVMTSMQLCVAAC